MEGMGYAPHLSLAFYDLVQTQSLMDAIDSISEDLPQLEIHFTGLGYFETATNIVLWAKPEKHSSLSELHLRLHNSIPAGNIRPAYQPGHWVPHCSLATSIPLNRKEQIIEFVEAGIKPFTVLFDTVDCVSFYPIEVVYERLLLPPNF